MDSQTLNLNLKPSTSACNLQPSLPNPEAPHNTDTLPPDDLKSHSRSPDALIGNSRTLDSYPEPRSGISHVSLLIRVADMCLLCRWALLPQKCCTEQEVSRPPPPSFALLAAPSCPPCSVAEHLACAACTLHACVALALSTLDPQTPTPHARTLWTLNPSTST